MEIDGRKIRVDYSITKRAHTPTPGVYMGKPTKSSYDDRDRDRDRGRHDDDRDDYYYDKGVWGHSSEGWCVMSDAPIISTPFVAMV